jgi:hypothetical protein
MITRYLATSDGDGCGEGIDDMIGIDISGAVDVGVTVGVGVNIGVGVSIDIHEFAERLITVRQFNINQIIPFFIHLLALSLFY